MQQDQSKIIFLICDDEEQYRETNTSLVSRVMRMKFVEPIPHEIHVFENGHGPLDFLEKKDDTKGVILISDHDMPRMTGSDLFGALDSLDLLPAHTFLCSRMQPDIFQMLVIDNLGIADAEKKITLLPKGGGYPFANHLPPAIQAVGKEIGIDLALRPQAQAPANGGKQGVEPQ